ncbi:MAG: DNA polymerase/3'-5' exonuclease PolX [bacterium]|nr:DNA polymerase/3'-5' exonuclease PolX [bacterium]
MITKNQELAKVFRQLAIFLEMKDIPFKPYAYERAALGVETSDKDMADIYHEGGLKALEGIPGVGKNIARAIEEFLISGEISQLSLMKKKMPVDLDGLMAVEGIGPKTIKEFWQKLKIRNLKDLEAAVKAGKIRKLANFGERSEKNILQSIVFVKKSKGRFLLGEILPEVEEIVSELKRLKEVERIDIAGSLRRRKETIGDADILVISKNPKKVTDFFVSLPGVAKIWGQGATKSSIRMKAGFDIDLRVVPAKSYGAALQYFTGSKEHNIATRKIAMEKKLKLNEYGLFRGKKMLASADEKDIYGALGLPYIEPELRENQGEVSGKLPKLVGYKDILGDLHCHSDWDGGKNSIAEMAEAVRKLGYQYIGIADHTKFLRIEHGLNERQLLAQRKEIDKLNTRYPPSLKVMAGRQNTKFKILQGCEANILNDGSIDIKDEVLAKLDFVIAGVHSNMKMSRPQMTERIIKAMENPNVDIISHPTGRILKRRDEYQVDFQSLLKAAKKTKTILEINASPERLDLNDLKVRQAKEAGVKMVINTDSHTKEYLRCMGFGISQARRGWAEKRDIINCWPLKRLICFLKH